MHLLSDLDPQPLELVRAEGREFKVLCVRRCEGKPAWWVLQSTGEHPTAYCFDAHCGSQPIWTRTKEQL